MPVLAVASASYVQAGFLGGELSKFAQGQYDRKDYRTCMNVCLNGHPLETGTWTRRSGTMFAGTTRGGLPGRVIKFDFQQSAAYTMSFTDGFVRFRAGMRLASTNDSVAVLAISGANPAVVQTAAAVTWATGDTGIFGGTKAGPITNRQFLLTKVDTTHFSIADAITGAAINGATIAFEAGMTISRIQELATPYVSGLWSSLRSVQAETNAVLLQGVVPPQILRVTTLPSANLDAQFSLSALTFLDGPYLDPFTNGVQVTPNAQTGNIILTLNFPAYVATKAYKVGDFVTSVNVNYISLADDNVNNIPAGSPTFWATTAAGAAINNGLGFLGSDVGRLVRLLSEPPVWVVGTTYALGNLVAYNPTGLAGAATYWTSLVAGNIGNIPGNDLVHWSLTPSNAAVWSWGKIITVSNSISQTLAGAVHIGSMTGGGGLAASFDSVNSKPRATSSSQSITTAGVFATAAFDTYIGQNFTAAAAQKIASAIIYPNTETGFLDHFSIEFGGNVRGWTTPSLTINLRAKASAPASASDGTLLGTTGLLSPAAMTAPVTITSTDQVTAWNFVWFELVGNVTNSDPASVGTTVLTYSAQTYFLNPPGTGVNSGVTIELLGPPLLYTNPIVTWRLGVYSATTGYPTCGAYHEGRLWLGGAVGNRFDASVSNGISGTTVNFAPTDQNGVVAASNAITYTVNAKGVNPIRWMFSELQGVLMGTQNGGWLAVPPTAGAITPFNIAARPLRMDGVAAIEPTQAGHTVVYVQRYARRLMECFEDVYSGKFTAPNLASRAMHLTVSGIAEVTFTGATSPMVWGRTNAGALFGITYRRNVLNTQAEPDFFGWHPHTLGSGRIVESITAGPSVGGDLDALTMVTNDTATNVRHVEILADLVEEGMTLADCTYLDDAVNPTAVSTSNVTPAPYGGLVLGGLWHLNGKTVQAWIGGLDCGLGEKGVITDFVVANGQITIPYGDGVSAGSGAGQFTAAYAATVPASQMLVGFTYTSDAQTVKPHAPAESGARSGPAFSKKRRNEQYGLEVEGTQGVLIGELFTNMRPVLFRQPNETVYLPSQQFTGTQWDTLDGDYTYDGSLSWRITRPYPCNVTAIGGFLSTQG